MLVVRFCMLKFLLSGQTDRQREEAVSLGRFPPFIRFSYKCACFIVYELPGICTESFLFCTPHFYMSVMIETVTNLPELIVILHVVLLGEMPNAI